MLTKELLSKFHWNLPKDCRF